MAETDPPQDAEPKKSKKPLLIGLFLAVFLGAGSFYAIWSGLILGGPHETAAAEVADLPDIAFVPVEPLIITLGPGGANRHLRFASQIEANGPHMAEVTLLLPRIADVMNGYLRALDPKVMEDPAALVRIRAQMLRRIQIVTGEGRVRDLLITEFVLN